jgi:prevent-host-death family protein
MHTHTKKVSAKEARDNFSAIINEVAFGNQHYTVTRHDKDVVVMIPAEEWRYIESLIQKLEDAADIRAADIAYERYMKKGGISHEEMKRRLGIDV